MRMWATCSDSIIRMKLKSLFPRCVYSIAHLCIIINSEQGVDKKKYVLFNKNVHQSCPIKTISLLKIALELTSERISNIKYFTLCRTQTKTSNLRPYMRVLQLFQISNSKKIKEARLEQRLYDVITVVQRDIIIWVKKTGKVVVGGE